MSIVVRGFGKQCVHTRGSLGSLANIESFAYTLCVVCEKCTVLLAVSGVTSVGSKSPPTVWVLCAIC